MLLSLQKVIVAQRMLEAPGNGTDIRDTGNGTRECFRRLFTSTGAQIQPAGHIDANPYMSCDYNTVQGVNEGGNM